MVGLRLSQALIVFLMAVLLPIQALVLPLVAADMAETAPEFAYLRWPLLVLAELMLLVADAVLIALIRLVSMTARRSVFSHAAVRWVNVAIAGLWAESAAVLPWLAVLVFVTKGPGVATIMCLIGLAAGVTAALIVTAMKALLVQATGQSEELAEVV